MHLGHAYSAYYTWNAATSLGGTALLRIEDTDPERSKPEFVAAIFEDLAWLGLEWPEPVLRQSERFEIYAEAGNRLRDQDLLYPCFCTRSEIAAHAGTTDPMARRFIRAPASICIVASRSSDCNAAIRCNSGSIPRRRWRAPAC